MDIDIRPFEAGQFDNFLEPVKEMFSRDGESVSSEAFQYRFKALGKKKQLLSVLRLAEELGARQIVWEKKYIDRHYLEDFTGYYSRCFNRYKRRCGRAHFFSSEFEAESFLKVLLDGNDQGLRDLGYIGYCVIKPLPHTVVGRTAMPPPPIAGAKFPVRENHGSLLGSTRLEVDCSLFQEQDNEVAACATVALWCALSATARKFDHPTLSPYEITTKANQAHNFSKRTLPNSGLNHFQMSAAIRAVGLDWFYHDLSSYKYRKRAYPDEPTAPGAKLASSTSSSKTTITEGADPSERSNDEAILAFERRRLYDTETAKGVLYAFLKSGIPPIMTLNYGSKNRYGRDVDRHAVAVVGYKLKRRLTKPVQGKQSRPCFVSNRLSELYVHDDNNGPYTKIEIVDDIVRVHGKDLESAYISQILTPVYHKIRTQIEDVIELVAEINTIYEIGNGGTENYLNIEWDLYLSDIQKARRLAVKSPCFAEDKARLIFKSAPKYLWVVSAKLGKNNLFDILLDATDLKQGGAIAAVLRYDKNFIEGFRKFEKAHRFMMHLEHNSARQFFDHLFSEE